jgi:sporulation protein YlmC with PRC-barrel domain
MSERMPQPAGRVIDAQLHLLDRQILDIDGVPVSVVTDVELTGIEPGRAIAPDAAPPTIADLLVGMELPARIFGGSPPRSRRMRIPWRLVSDVGTVLRIGVAGSRVDATWVERWVGRHIVGRIPGGRHAPD